MYSTVHVQYFTIPVLVSDEWMNESMSRCIAEDIIEGNAKEYDVSLLLCYLSLEIRRIYISTVQMYCTYCIASSINHLIACTISISKLLDISMVGSL